MAFQIAEGFFDGPHHGKYPVQVRVVYFDEGMGRWALQYDAVSTPQKTALEVRKTGTGRWKESIVTINDGAFTRRGALNSDLALVSLDGADDTFHLVELTRQTGDRKGYWGD